MVYLTRCLEVLAYCAVVHSWKCSEHLAGLHCLFWEGVSRYMLPCDDIDCMDARDSEIQASQLCASISEHNVKTLRVQ